MRTGLISARKSSVTKTMNEFDDFIIQIQSDELNPFEIFDPFDSDEDWLRFGAYAYEESEREGRSDK